MVHYFVDCSAAKWRTGKLDLSVTRAHSDALYLCGTGKRETPPACYFGEPGAAGSFAAARALSRFPDHDSCE